jgi:hypothetical protein
MGTKHAARTRSDDTPFATPYVSSFVLFLWTIAAVLCEETCSGTGAGAMNAAFVVGDLTGDMIASNFEQRQWTDSERLSYAEDAIESEDPDQRYAGLVAITTVNESSITNGILASVHKMMTDGDNRVRALSAAFLLCHSTDEVSVVEDIVRLRFRKDDYYLLACRGAIASDPHTVYQLAVHSDPLVRCVAMRRCGVLHYREANMAERGIRNVDAISLRQIMMYGALDSDQVVRSSSLAQLLGQGIVDDADDTLLSMIRPVCADAREVLLLEDVTTDEIWDGRVEPAWKAYDRWLVLWIGRAASRFAPMLTTDPGYDAFLPPLEETERIGRSAGVLIAGSSDMEGIKHIRHVAQHSGNLVLEDQLNAVLQIGCK